MAVDFEFKSVPEMRIASYTWKGSWSDARIHRGFLTAAAWAKKRKLRTGRWIFEEPNTKTFVMSVEIKGKAKSGDGVRVRRLRAARVASVLFDPEVVEPRVVYHGLTDWLRWRRKEKTIRSVGAYREVYLGDPWKDKKAYARTEVQVVVRK